MILENSFLSKVPKHAHLCANDQSCNAWKFDSGSCTKYSIQNLQHFNENDVHESKIGYIFKPNDTWAVEDLSELPTEKQIFKDVARYGNKIQM